MGKRQNNQSGRLLSVRLTDEYLEQLAAQYTSQPQDKTFGQYVEEQLQALTR